MKLTRIVFFTVLLISGIIFTGCEPGEDDPTVISEKEWTVMVFLNGDNNLDSFGDSDVKEMEKIGSNKNINIIVLRDYLGTEKSTKIFKVEKGKSTIVKDYGKDIDTGSWQTLVDFFKYVKENHPAKRYMIDIWNHGSGWKRPVDSPSPIVRGISYDDTSGSHITTAELATALNEISVENGNKQIDLLGMDACLMQMAEVVHEIDEKVGVIVGSEPNEPGDGWEYSTFLGDLAANPAMGAEALGTSIVNSYVSSYSGGLQGSKAAHLSAISTEKFKTFTYHLNNLLDALVTDFDTLKETLLETSSETQYFDYSYWSKKTDHKDVIHFLTLLKSKLEEGAVKNLAEDTLSVAQDMIIKSGVSQGSFENAMGLAIWLPERADYDVYKTRYKTLKWVNDTSWDEFIKLMAE